MGQHMHAPHAGNGGEIADQALQGVAGGGGALLGRDIAQHARFRGPGEQHGHAAKSGVHGDLGQPQSGLIKAGVEAMDIEQDVAIPAHPTGNMGAQFAGEAFGRHGAGVGQGEMALDIGLAEGGRLDDAGLMIGRHAHHDQGVVQATVAHSVANPPIIPAGGGDEHGHRTGGALRRRLEQAHGGADALAHAA